MFGFFERLVNPFPPESPQLPPRGIYAFCRYYIRGIEHWLVLMGVLTAITAVSEAMLFGILGQVVDWLAGSDRETFFADSWPMLLGMTVFMLMVIPLVTTAHPLVVRDTVMKLLDVILFVIIYLTTTLILVASADYRLCLPLLVWLLFYIFVQRHFVPRMKNISTRQADARSLMTGRIVDSYTNIVTLKLFSHSAREADYVKDGMSEFLDTVHPQMRLVTQLNITLWTLNMFLVFGTGAMGIYLWTTGVVDPGAVAIVMSLAIRLTGMSHWIMWEISSLFENIGIVTQDTSLLHRSVRENIMFGRPDASEAQMIAAAQQAQAHEFILGLRDSKGRTGYDAHVGERGVTLSGGQRQRVAIARVLLKDAPILVLDEATSALDSEVEATIQESLNKLMQGKTVIAIAHRLSTIAAMDKLIVFDQGKIVEQGTHQQLIALNGVYAKLWSHQSGGFLGFD